MVMPNASRTEAQRRSNRRKGGEELLPFANAPRPTMESVRTRKRRPQQWRDRARCRPKLTDVRSAN
eukprot:3247460-Lingulodinium_polyedra.AAC.1